MRKKDLLWAAALALTFVIGSGVWLFWGREQGEYAVIARDGEILYRLPLAQTREITVSGEWGSNTVKISPKGIAVTEADCPDGLCRKQGIVQKRDVPIVCLPHKLTVRIEGDDNEK